MVPQVEDAQGTNVYASDDNFEPLFSFFGAALKDQLVPGLASQITAYVRAMAVGRSRFVPRLVKRYSGEGHYDRFQIELSLPVPELSNVVPFAPVRRHVYLDYGIMDAFACEPNLKTISRKLENRGIHVLGDLVQLAEKDVKAMSFMSDELFEILRKHLARIEFRLGMRVPYWNRKNQINPGL